MSRPSPLNGADKQVADLPGMSGPSLGHLRAEPHKNIHAPEPCMNYPRTRVTSSKDMWASQALS